MKIFALDVGDVWTGTAISDALGMFARPYKTVGTEKIEDFLRQTLDQESITTIVVGYPKTMRGTESEQTYKIVSFKEDLQARFPDVEWVLWDERLSSKRAEQIKKCITKEDKLLSHSVAAAFILESYLEFKHFHQD
jgi:putative Holliday junction resolvase